VTVAREDFDATLKAMFRIRGETARINIGDALGHQFYDKLGLGADFEMAVRAMRYCLKIRNQYAHCNWDDDRLSGRLAFVTAYRRSPSLRLSCRQRKEGTHRVRAAVEHDHFTS